MTATSIFPNFREDFECGSYVFLAGVLFAGASMAQSPITRITTTTIQVGSLDFASSFATYANTIDFDTVAGMYSATVNPVAAATGTYFTGFGGSSVLPGTAADGSTPVLITLTSPGGAGPGLQVRLCRRRIANARREPHHPLRVPAAKTSCPMPVAARIFSSDGGLFTSTVVISGDWSSAASHSAATFASGYSLISDFVYDSVLNVTDLAVSTSNYQDVNPSIAFDLYGSAVPVPEAADWAMMMPGLVALGLAWRRRRATANAKV